MKKNLLMLLLLCSTIAALAQESKKEDEKVIGNNEIRLNLLNTIIGIPEISYERLFNDNSGAGLSVLVGIDDNTEYKFGVIPYYRVYFGNNTKKRNWFFY